MLLEKAGFSARIALVILLVFFLAFSINAFPLNSPNNVTITGEQSSFLVEITNTSNEQKELSLLFFSTSESIIRAPKIVPPNSTVSAEIIVKNNFSEKTSIRSTLEVYLGDDLQRRKIDLTFHPTEGQEAYPAGLFLLLSDLFGRELTMMDLFLVFVLIIVIIVLLFSLAKRLKRRSSK